MYLHSDILNSKQAFQTMTYSQNYLLILFQFSSSFYATEQKILLLDVVNRKYCCWV